jgi:hypothetical protein
MRASGGDVRETRASGGDLFCKKGRQKTSHGIALKIAALQYKMVAFHHFLGLNW